MEQYRPVPFLPIEIVEQIISYLKEGDHGYFALVCRDWCELFRARRAREGRETWVLDFRLFTGSIERINFTFDVHPEECMAAACGHDLPSFKTVGSLLENAHMPELLEHVWRRYELKAPDGNMASMVSATVARRGTTAALQALGRYGFLALNEITIAAAALGGSRKNVEFLRRLRCPYDERTCASAALGGHLDLLQWLREQRCSWDEQTCMTAAESGHIHILEWVLARVPAWTETALAAAGRAGQLSVLQWLQEEGDVQEEGERVAAAVQVPAAAHGHVHILKWARQTQGRLCADLGTHAAAGGHLDVLQWLREVGETIDYAVCEAAIKNQKLDVLEWALGHKAMLTSTVSYIAVKEGRLDVLQWAHARGFEITRGASTLAASMGDLATLQWMHKQGVKMHADMAVSALHCERFHVMAWLHEIGCRWDREVWKLASKRCEFRRLQKK